MRLIYPCLSLVIVGVAARAAATSCAQPERGWQDSEIGPLRDHAPAGASGVAVPVDAAPWDTVPCDRGAPAMPPSCALVDRDTGVRSAVTAEFIGAEVCERPLSERVEYTHPYYVRRFTPSSPLAPGSRLEIECDGVSFGDFSVRDSDAVAAPPGRLELATAYFRRGDDGGCCGSSDIVEIELVDMRPGFLAEGGYIEVRYPSGQRLVLGATEDDRLMLPGAREVVELTPVAASGARGEPLIVDAGEIDGDAVYLPCAIGGRRAGGALWLALPLGWLCAQTRRRRST